ncbi:TPA: hypothetical protein ACGO6M_002225 [Streptococcus suis]|nr:hypothetical protein [Streptococcus suis]
MKKISYYTVTILSALTLAACATSTSAVKTTSETVESQSSAASTTNSTETSAEQTYTPLTIGDSYTFGEGDYINGGLKITLTEAYVDESVQLNQEYSSENYDGYLPVIVKTTFENTGNNYVDITNFEILDSEGHMGKWAPYIEGVSTLMPDGLSPNQKVHLIDVYAIKNNVDFDLTYGGITWSVKK